MPAVISMIPTPGRAFRLATGPGEVAQALKNQDYQPGHHDTCSGAALQAAAGPLIVILTMKLTLNLFLFIHEN